MTEVRAQRRLAAILAADVVGYSRLIGADEDGTLAAMREVWADRFNPSMANYGGRIVKMMGDGALVEFGSAVEAVEGAVRLQAVMGEFNTGRPDRQPIIFRVGVNLGDIVIQGDDILGDGVNVAARLEPLAPRGGILVSDAIHAQVRGKVSVEFEDAGELDLKNIEIPVRAWFWGGDETVGLPRHEDVPSVAVLPFNNMSGDPEQEYFSDGISEDIITDLSKVSGLMVVARNSSFAYKGRSPDIRAVGRELGVGAVLEGSIRKAGNRVRINAQLIDARTGGHIWADRYDRDVTDIFAVQDEVTMEIVGALKVQLRPAERARIGAQTTDHPEAHDLVMRAREIAAGLMDSPENAGAEVKRIFFLLKAAIAIDAKFAVAHAFLSKMWALEYINRWSGFENPLEHALEYARKAVKLDPNEPAAHSALAIALIYDRDLGGAMASAQRAVELNPNMSVAVATIGHVHTYLDDPLAAIPFLERAMRLDPAYAHQHWHFIGFANLRAGKWQAAAEAFRERIRLSPRTDLSRAFLVSALGHLGEVEEARKVWAELREVNPDYSLEDHLARLPFREACDGNCIRAGVEKAGVAA